MEQPLLAVADEVSYAGTTQLVTHGRHHTQGLVEGKVDTGRVQLNPGPINVDSLGAGVDPHAQRGDDVLTGPPATDAGCGQELLQAYAVRIMDIDLDRRLLALGRQAGGLAAFGGATTAALRGTATLRGVVACRALAGSLETATSQRLVAHARPRSARSSSTSTSGK